MAMAPEIHEFEVGSKHCAKNSRSVARDRQDAAPFGHGRCASAAKERACYALIGRAHALGMASACAPFIHIGHGAWAWRVLHLQVRQIEAGQTDKFIYLSIQMTAARHAAPGRSDPVLPIFDAWLRRKSVLDKTEIPVWLEYPPHLAQRGQRIRNRTKCQVITTVSTALSVSGIAVAEPRRSSTGTGDAAARRRAIASNLGEGSIP